MRALLLIVTILPSALAAQSAYRCTTPTGTIYQDRPCAVDDEPIQIHDADFGEAKNSWQIEITGTYCRLEHGYITGSGYVVNKTAEPAKVTVITSFIGSMDSVRSSIDLPYIVPAHSRTPFSHTATAAGADSCRYQVRW